MILLPDLQERPVAERLVNRRLPKASKFSKIGFLNAYGDSRINSMRPHPLRASRQWTPHPARRHDAGTT